MRGTNRVKNSYFDKEKGVKQTTFTYVVDFTQSWDKQLQKWIAVTPEQQVLDKEALALANKYCVPDDKGIVRAIFWTFDKGNNAYIYVNSDGKMKGVNVEKEIRIDAKIAKLADEAEDLEAYATTFNIRGESLETVKRNIITSKFSSTRVVERLKLDDTDDLGVE